ncbi:MAG: hypothetical protein U1A27_00480 [Phycisphaerae bacterium]
MKQSLCGLALVCALVGFSSARAAVVIGAGDLNVSAIRSIDSDGDLVAASSLPSGLNLVAFVAADVSKTHNYGLVRATGTHTVSVAGDNAAALIDCHNEIGASTPTALLSNASCYGQFDFTVTAPSAYLANGNWLLAAGEGSFATQVRLVDDLSNVLLDAGTTAFHFGAVSDTFAANIVSGALGGPLVPGRIYTFSYLLQLTDDFPVTGTATTDAGDMTGSVSLEIRLVPEPASALLLVAGLLAARRRAR